MRFKQFIIEKELDLVSKCNIIKSKCSQFINEAGNYPAYRGQKQYSFENNTHLERKQKDLRLNSTNLFNLYAEEKFNIEKIRTKNAAFSSGYFKEVNLYGDIFFFFPEDGYHYVWSPLVRDFLGREDIIWNKIYSETLAKLSSNSETTTEEILKLFTKFNQELKTSNFLTVKDIKNDNFILEGKNVYDIIKPFMIDVFEDLEYKNTNLKQALDSGVELIFTTKKYFLISVDEVDKYYELNLVDDNEGFEIRYKNLIGLLK